MNKCKTSNTFFTLAKPIQKLILEGIGPPVFKERSTGPLLLKAVFHFYQVRKMNMRPQTDTDVSIHQDKIKEE